MTAGWFLILGVRGKKRLAAVPGFLMQASPHVNKPFWASVVWGKSRRMTRLLPLSNHSLLPAGYLSGAAAAVAILSDQKNKRNFGCRARRRAVSTREFGRLWHLNPFTSNCWPNTVEVCVGHEPKCLPVRTWTDAEAIQLVGRGEDLQEPRTVRDGCWSLELREGK